MVNFYQRSNRDSLFIRYIYLDTDLKINMIREMTVRKVVKEVREGVPTRHNKIYYNTANGRLKCSHFAQRLCKSLSFGGCKISRVLLQSGYPCHPGFW